MSDSQSPPEVRAKKRRNRKAASCNPCRTRKLRCDRALPCSSCISKGHAELCIWDAAAAPPLYEARERNETESLRHEVDRLQSLINVLISDKEKASPSAHSTSPFPSPPSAHAEEHKDEDLAAHDLAQKLGHLTIKAFHTGEKQESTHSIVQEAEEILNNPSGGITSPALDGNFVLNAPQPVAAFSDFPFSRSKNTSTREILSRLPSKPQADAAARYYYTTTDWYLHPVPAYIFTQHAEQVWQAQTKGTHADPFSLAICFAIWAVGLFGMSTTKASVAGLPSTVAAKEALATDWLDLSSTSLALGRFLERPTLEAIRALLLLATHYVALSPGDNGGAGIAYLVLTIQCCISMKMQRDPDKMGAGSRFSAGEAEDRRRLFWLAFLASQTAATTYGRKMSMLHLSDIDTKLPLDIEDELMGAGLAGDGGETIMTSLIVRIKIAQLAEKISDEVFGIQPVSYSQILGFDRQVSEVERDVFEHYRYSAITYDVKQQPIRALRTYMIQLALCQERLRLHRPYLARSYIDDTFAYSRQICLDASRQILEMQAAPICHSPWSGLQYKSCQAAIIFCIDLLYSPYGAQAGSERAMVDQALGILDSFAKISTLCRRGSKVIRFMLAKLPSNSPAALPSSQSDRPANSKRSRTSSDSRSSHSSNSPTFAHSLDGGASGAEDVLPRKLPPSTTSSIFATAHESSIYPSPPAISTPTYAHADSHAHQAAEELSTFDINSLLGLNASSPSAFNTGSSSVDGGGFNFLPVQHTPPTPMFRPAIGSRAPSTGFDFGAATAAAHGIDVGRGFGAGSGNGVVATGSDGDRSGSRGGDGFIFGAGASGGVGEAQAPSYFDAMSFGGGGASQQIQQQQHYGFEGIDTSLSLDSMGFGVLFGGVGDGSL